ncbi:MAG TPA: hypothetical protein VFC57_06380 [Aeromicrobium sp.]|nr:hypothetical protein [Aeromicrobium sp.]
MNLGPDSARALGFELPRPNPEVKAQWAVFDAMIKLMTPQGFADLMKTMKPMFPTLFPKLLPQMMPELLPRVMDNLMPHMLSAVAPLITDDLIAYLKNGKGAKEPTPVG